MAMTFPSTPTVGQRYTSGSNSWVWTGTTWDAVLPYEEPLSGFLLMGAG